MNREQAKELSSIIDSFSDVTGVFSGKIGWCPIRSSFYVAVWDQTIGRPHKFYDEDSFRKYAGVTKE